MWESVKKQALYAKPESAPYKVCNLRQAFNISVPQVPSFLKCGVTLHTVGFFLGRSNNYSHIDIQIGKVHIDRYILHSYKR